MYQGRWLSRSGRKAAPHPNMRAGRIRGFWICAILILQSFMNRTPVNAQTERTVRVPSQAAGTDGLVVRITVPGHPRYPEGAPVVVYMAGGFDGNGIAERITGLDGEGFIEIRFNFPGSGTGENLSG
jgi:hypothetical protein